MTNELALKVYKIDYDFIIKNYLSPALWEKVWTLFLYKNIHVTIQIDAINLHPKSIRFIVRIRQDNYTTYECVYYYFNDNGYSVLMKQINSAMERLIIDLESYYITQEHHYKLLMDSIDEETEMLENIANEFLDDNGVTNEKIREVYVDNYIKNNRKTYDLMSRYRSNRKYEVMTDLYLVFYKITQNKEQFSKLSNLISIDNTSLIEDIERISDIFNDDTDSEKYQEYTEDMKSLLCDI